MPKQSPSEEGLGPLERGRSRYQQKDYAGALSAFNEAVNISTSHILLNALDHRAAAYEKLGQLQPALRDAKRMIDLKSDASKGYLRCGKILQLKGENALALKIYERGLGKVKIGTDEQRTLLQSMSNKLQRAQNPEKTLDPLKYLPLELAEMVCLQMTTRDRVVCLAVSKGWKRVLESSHKLWTTLDTTATRQAINQKSLKAYLKRSNYTLEHAIITMKANFDAYRMGYLTRTCKNLKTLELRGSGMISDSLLSALPDARKLESIILGPQVQFPLCSVVAALKCCKDTLVRASFHGITRAATGRKEWPQMNSLQILQLSAYGSETNDVVHVPNFGFEDLLKGTPSLRVAALTGWQLLLRPVWDLRAWSKLEDLQLPNTNLKKMPNLPVTLKHLSVRNNPHLAIEDGNDISNLPILETLNISGTFIEAQGLRELTSAAIKNNTLKSLDLGRRVSDVTNRHVPGEFPVSATLEELSISSLILGDKQVTEIVGLYPNLIKLDASQTKITGVAVKYCVERGITSLKLNECSNISSDAIEWARGKGVEVEFNFPSEAKRGFRDAMASGY